MVIGIIRGVSPERLAPVLSAAIAGGLKSVEITLNTPQAFTQISSAVQQFGQKLSIGAGTVCTVDDARKAVAAGATFIVSPIADADTITFCNENKIPVFPGALTPSEVYRAWTLGATMVKVFPASALGGAAYIKDLKGPFDQIPLLACSGVTPENLKDYVQAGISGVAIGNGIFNPRWMAEGEFGKIEEAARAFVNAWLRPPKSP